MLLLTGANTIQAQDKIVGPWLWMCLKIDGAGGAAAVDQDTLKLRSNGQVTEDKIANNGAQFGVEQKSLPLEVIISIQLLISLIFVTVIAMIWRPMLLSKLKQRLLAIGP